MSDVIPNYADKLHCCYCYDMLISELHGKDSSYEWSELPYSNHKMPLFVTWYKKSEQNDWDLRGCIGTFSNDLPIKQGLKKYAILSGLHDKRFEKIAIDEMITLKCSVSLLHSFTKAKSWDDWIVGINGITINFVGDNDKSYNATYLPEVSVQEKWDKLTTIKNLIAKAGYKSNLETIKSITITKYQSCKYSLTWNSHLIIIRQLKSFSNSYYANYIGNLYIISGINISNIEDDDHDDENENENDDEFITDITNKKKLNIYYTNENNSNNYKNNVEIESKNLDDIDMENKSVLQDDKKSKASIKKIEESEDEHDDDEGGTKFKEDCNDYESNDENDDQNDANGSNNESEDEEDNVAKFRSKIMNAKMNEPFPRFHTTLFPSNHNNNANQQTKKKNFKFMEIDDKDSMNGIQNTNINKNDNNNNDNNNNENVNQDKQDDKNLNVDNENENVPATCRMDESANSNVIDDDLPFTTTIPDNQ